MSFSEIGGLSFVLGILGIGVTFIIYYFKGNSSLCERVTKLETKMDMVLHKLEQIRKQTDQFHPRS